MEQKLQMFDEAKRLFGNDDKFNAAVFILNAFYRSENNDLVVNRLLNLKSSLRTRLN